jgi:hypothetical protein
VLFLRSVGKGNKVSTFYKDYARAKSMSEKTEQKRPYIKPEAVRISLRPEEAVLGNCKSTAVSGPGGSGNCMPIGPCFSQGS